MVSRRRKKSELSEADRVVARFGNRIVGTGVQKAGQLLANPSNWRIHPMAQQQALEPILEKIGWVQSVIVNKRTHVDFGESRFVETIIDGHLRVLLALKRGDDTDVPVTYVDLDPDEEAVILASFDPISAMATTDHEKHRELSDRIPDDWKNVTSVLRLERRASKQVSFEATTTWRVVVDCDNEGQRDALLHRLESEGYRCR